MKKNLFCMWLLLLATLFSVNTQAQMTIGGKKEPEAFSVLELLNKGGLRLPQMTTAERNAFAVKNNDKGNGLTIYNKTTNCVEYWNATRWVSLCEGTSQTVISPQPCVNVAADGTGCDQTFTVDDVDCPNGPFNISITAGGEYASLTDVDNANGKFKINFFPNETVNIHTVLVRVTSTCTSLFKEFLFSQNGVDCTSMPYAVPTLTASATTICTGGAVYLSVPANTANLDKLIWTRNGVEVARGVNYYVATQKGEYNISMGAVGCNINDSNKRNITESGSATPVTLSVSATNSGVICGTNKVTLTASGNSSGTIVWFHNGVQEKTGSSIDLDQGSNVGEWFAAVKDGSCYSKQSASIQVTKSEAAGQISLPAADVLVNGVPLNTFTKFCSGGSLNLSVANKINGVTYTWYNGNDVITTNPYVVPTSQSTLTLSLKATDNSGAKCAAEQSVIDANIIQGSTPIIKAINGSTTICGGSTKLTIEPKDSGTYTYTWYKNNEIITDAVTDNILADTPGAEYSAEIKNTTGCVSPRVSKTILNTISDFPVLTWKTDPKEALYGAKITMQTDIQFGPAIDYKWATDNTNAKITPAADKALIELPPSGDTGTVLKITVQAKNVCGNSEVLEYALIMKNDCPTPTVISQTALTQNATAGSKAKVAVGVTKDGLNPSYQWYSNASKSASGGSAIAGQTSAALDYTVPSAGDYYFYCIVKNNCAGAVAVTSDVFYVKVSKNPIEILDGAGTLSGKTCFDIAESNFNDKCGTEDSRSSNRTDFNTANTQYYTFTVVGPAVSNVRFVYVDPSGNVVEKFEGDNNGNNISGTVIATMTYKKTLSSSSKGANNGTAFGLTTDNALSVDLYVIYNNKADGSGTDAKVKITAQIKDCMCCGAKISPTEWKSFMCYNLGVTNQSLNPLIPVPALNGSYYLFGASAAGQARSSNLSAWTGADGGPNNPCPAGYRVPTPEEWQGVIANNKLTFVYNGSANIGTAGVKIGESLMLPMTASISQPLFYFSTWSNGNYDGGVYTSGFEANLKYVNGWLTPKTGGSIRCISKN